MSKVSFEVDESHGPLWEDKDWRYAFLMGGRGNGRSGSASRFAVSGLLGKEYFRGALMRGVHSDIRASSWSEVIDRVHEQGIEEGFRIVDNDMFIERGENSLRAHGFKSSSGSLTARLKSLANYNFVWIEEAEETVESEFMKLDDSLRTVKGPIRLIFTLNTPAKSHWLIRRFFDLTPHPDAPGFFVPSLKPEHQKDAIYIPGTFRENIVNIDPHTQARYLSYKNTDPLHYYQVIEGLCPEELKGKIYSGWSLIDAVPKEARLVRFGQDYGWSPDPACVVAIYYYNGAYVIDELAYGTELTNEYLAQQIKAVDKGRLIPATSDSAEPKSIAEQKKYGINAQPCAKGQDSVRHRIQLVSTKKIYVTRRSTNVWDSYENYAWAYDKDGVSKGEPVHTHSHAMDAVGYALADLHGKPTATGATHTPPRTRKNVAV
jgi:phage terminase large subunit